MSFFTVKNLSASYNRIPIFTNISFELNHGNLLGILGPNGCGKTTLLKAICGILPHSGVCTLEHHILEQLSPKQFAQLCHYIPQRSGISIDISALDVVLMGFNPYLKLFEHPTPEMKKQALSTLACVGLSGKEHINYMHLSEGQKQLCILARTLVSDSRLLILDEPESALDFHFRYQMLETLKRWVKTGKNGIIITLHDPTLALNYCDQLLLLSDGKILSQLFPKTDSIDKMEQQLSRLYGNISLHPCKDKNGNTKLLMMKESDFYESND